MTIYIDNLGLKSLRCWWSFRKKDITVFEEQSYLKKFIFHFFSILGSSVTEKNFFLGDEDKKSKFSHYQEATRFSFKLACELANVYCRDGFVRDLNISFDRETLRLSLTKFYQIELFEFSKRVILMRSLVPDGSLIYIKKPDSISRDFINQSKLFENVFLY